MDDDLRALRKSFCRATADSLRNIAGWLSVDATLGGGDYRELYETQLTDPDRFVAFRATAVVIEMASELVSGAVAQLNDDRRFAASTLIRQLLETEYLLRAFAEDFSQASKWALSSPDEIRRLFAPKTMRQIAGFSNTEYWNHCNLGGHPSPSGRALLRFSRVTSKGDDPFMDASLWGDLAQHLRRLWLTIDELLLREHARYETVRNSDRQQINEMILEWDSNDPLSRTTDFQRLEDVVESEA